MTGALSFPVRRIAAFTIAFAVAAALLAPLASAEGSTVRALSPVTIAGDGEAVLWDSGFLVLTAPTEGDEEDSPSALSFVFTADSLVVKHTEVREECVASPEPGMPAQCWPASGDFSMFGDGEAEKVLTDAVVRTQGAPRADLVVAVELDGRDDASDDDDSGSSASRLRARHSDDATLSAPSRGTGYRADAPPWSGASFSIGSSEDDFLYQFRDFSARADGAVLAFLQGVDVTVEGTDGSGSKVEYSFRTGTRTEDNTATTTRIHETLELAASDANVDLVYGGAGTVAGTPTVTSFDALELTRASGSFPGSSTEYADEDVVIDGRVEFAPTAFETDRSTGDRFIVLDVMHVRSSEAPFAPAGARDAQDSESVARGAAAGAAVFGALGAAAAGAYYWPTLRFGLTALLAPLYSRIEKDDVLTHEKREEIYGLIRSAPGIHAHEISEKAGIGWGTTVYHLRLLENHRLVVSKRSGRYKRFFLNSGAPGAQKDAYGALRNDTAARIGQFILKNPGTTQKEVCAGLGLSPSLVSWHVQRLEESELVKKVKEGRRVRYFAGPAWNEIDVDVVRGLGAAPAAGLAATAAPAQVAMAAGDDGRDN